MSMFYCVLCDNMADSDDGCIESLSGLICVECEADGELEEELPDDDPA